MLADFLADLVESLRDTFALILFTVFAAWLYAPDVAEALG